MISNKLLFLILICSSFFTVGIILADDPIEEIEVDETENKIDYVTAQTPNFDIVLYSHPNNSTQYLIINRWSSVSVPYNITCIGSDGSVDFISGVASNLTIVFLNCTYETFIFTDIPVYFRANLTLNDHTQNISENLMRKIMNLGQIRIQYKCCAETDVLQRLAYVCNSCDREFGRDIKEAIEHAQTCKIGTSEYYEFKKEDD